MRYHPTAGSPYIVSTDRQDGVIKIRVYDGPNPNHVLAEGDFTAQTGELVFADPKTPDKAAMQKVVEPLLYAARH